MDLEEYVGKMFFEKHTIRWNPNSLIWWDWRRWSLLHLAFNSNQELRRLLQRSARRW
jgi:alpha-ketoglutarate-dependent taurine dioxygenase